MIRTINKYLSLVKFAHTIFAMPFALIGFFMAVVRGQARFSWILLLEVVLCMVFARSAAMAFNRWLDAEFDGRNPRTARREIPAGVIPAKSALLFVIINCLLFLLTTWFINLPCFLLAPVALFVVLGYSYTKRFTPLCHLVLGLGLSLAPIGAYLAVTGQFNVVPLILSCIVLFWVSGFDIIYALQDEEFDRDQHLNSIPAWLGKAGGLRFSEILHVAAAALVITLGVVAGMHWIFWIGAAVYIGMLIYQHALVKPNDLSKVDLAFMTTNGIASVVFAAFTIADLFVY